ncbi:hypothetical protein M878_18230 [Streptomyces roseochromogenus subsp. oscitans DS 12.976]|uniref:Metallo-beta-lactamase domain-containing protein n=1 Tax=Streptomyces roseochromogenus subsp. oscitans DS 12.976 TaxID=1352936 RepID=V6KGT7_STRRC|nr:hypothetical protein M878_18230 [Streptomyces roseochromogenus subsp. oscitans DS 12.976]
MLAAGVPASLYGPELYARLGIDAGGAPVPDLLIDALPHPGYDPRTHRVDPLPVTRTLLDGDTLAVGGRTLTVLHLPGHTPGCIALYEERTGALYTGDVLYDGELIDDLPESDPPAYRRSLARLERLVDLGVRVVLPGHGRPFGPDRLRDLAGAYARRPC